MTPLRYGHFEVKMGADGLPIRLGPGGMGTTYRAFDTHLRIVVALKVIDDRRLAEPGARRRFFNEARIAAQLDHPNIARVLYLCPEDAKTCFFAMELVEGETLSQRLVRTGPLEPGEALRLLRQIVDALACLGRNQLVHRDLKPENVMLGADPRGALRVKLIDFGLAKTVAPEGAAGAALEEAPAPGESDATFLGSACFASPEQVRAGPLDQRSDFYALGATLWHALTGAPPFTGTLFAVQQSQVTREPPWEKVSHLPASTLTLLLRSLLAKEPAARPADAAALARQWDAASAEIAPPAPQPRAGALARLALTPESLGSRRQWRRAEAVPHGSSPPATSGFLARDLSSQAWYFIRPLPATLPALLRAEIVAAAQRAGEARHPALRKVLEVCENCIVSEWELGLHLAQLLAERGRPWPLEQVVAWLPGLAEAVDFARERELSGLSLALVHQWLEFKPAAAAEPVELGSLTRVRLDPLAAFDPMLEAFAAMGMVPESLLVVPRVVALPSPYLAATVYRLLGGEEPPPEVPLAPVPDLDPVRNRLLLDTIESRVPAATAGEWAASFTRGVPLAPAAPPAPPPLPRGKRVPVVSAVAAAGKSGPRSLLLFCGLSVLVAAGLIFGLWKKPPPRVDPPIADQGDAGVITPTPLPPLRTENFAPVNRVEPQPVTAAPAARARPLPPLPAGYFENTLGMRFQPCTIAAAADARPLWASIWETRQADYDAFLSAKGRKPAGAAPRSPDHPAVMVSWLDAREFCRWLTAKERANGTIAATLVYRLPTDHEWSSFVVIAGIGDEHPGIPLWQKHQRITDLYGWGAGWPPPRGSGNFADATAKQQQPDWTVIRSYDDGFAGTAPVGSFPPNAQGFFDLGGNVAEWVREEAGVEGHHIVRGGAFTYAVREELRASCRIRQPTKMGRGDIGFRVVLARTSP